jgi:hypothetical protein
MEVQVFTDRSQTVVTAHPSSHLVSSQPSSSGIARPDLGPVRAEAGMRPRALDTITPPSVRRINTEQTAVTNGSNVCSM